VEITDQLDRRAIGENFTARRDRARDRCSHSFVIGPLYISVQRLPPPPLSVGLSALGCLPLNTQKKSRDEKHRGILTAHWR
jgi:hypothetical protein